MKQIVKGVPNTVEVDGQTYRVVYNQGWFRAYVNSKSDTVEAVSYAELPEKIRTWIKDDAAEREAARKARAAASSTTEKVPVVWAILNSNGEKVQVRGVSSKSHRWDVKYLITRANGKKETVGERSLGSLDTDVGALVRIDAETRAINAEANALKEAGKVDPILNPLRQADLDVQYSIEDNTFTGTYQNFVAVGENPRDVDRAITRQVIAEARPWSVETNHEDFVPRVVATIDSSKDHYYGYDAAWATKEEAERYAELQAKLSDLSKQRSALREGFDYAAELDKVRAAQRVLAGEAEAKKAATIHTLKVVGGESS